MPAGPRPVAIEYSGPCYDSQCQEFRAKLDAQIIAAQAQWDYEAETERSNALIAKQKAAIIKQAEQEKAIKSQYEALTAEAQKQAGIAKKQATAVVGQQRVQSNIAAAQAAQELQRTAQTEQTTRRSTGTSVGQPGVSRTRVGARLALGGYGGTAAGKVNPTGLNI